MTLRNYFVTIHKDGHVTVQEYVETKVVRDAYNQALRDVLTILDYEKFRCSTYGEIKKYGQEWVASWGIRSSECDLLKSSIEKLFRKS